MKYAWLCLIALPATLAAQDYAEPLQTQPKRTPPPTTGFNFGIGIGLDYGGFGGQLQYVPLPPLALFAGGGYALAGVGYNVGAQWRLAPAHRGCPFISAMYGYNAAIVVENASEFNALYYGPSFGMGIELHRKRSPTSFWRFELLIPLRPQAFEDAMDALRTNPNVKIQGEPPALGVGAGYHFGA